MASTLQLNTSYSSDQYVGEMKEDKFKEEEEEEDDLFEIDLEAVGNLPPPYYWESYLTATTSTLFANCLVPIANVSSALPMANPKDAKLTSWLGPGSTSVIWVRGAEPFQNFSRVASSGALSNMLQKTLNDSSSFTQAK